MDVDKICTLFERINSIRLEIIRTHGERCPTFSSTGSESVHHAPATMPG